MLAHAQRVHIGRLFHRLQHHRSHLRVARLKSTGANASVNSTYSNQESLIQALQTVLNQHDPITLALTGVTFDNRQANLARIKEGM